MKHSSLIAIAVGSILGTALPLAYADGNQPAAAPGYQNQQQAVDAQGGSSQAAAERDWQTANTGSSAGRADVANDQAERKDVQRDRADTRADDRDLRTDRRDVRDDVRADRQDLRNDRHDFRTAQQGDFRSAQRGDLRSDRHDQGLAKNGNERLTSVMSERMDAHDVDARRVDANARRADIADQSAWRRSELTATTLANNAAENSRKPPSTQDVHKAWYHYFWW